MPFLFAQGVGKCRQCAPLLALRAASSKQRKAAHLFFQKQTASAEERASDLKAGKGGLERDSERHRSRADPNGKPTHDSCPNLNHDHCQPAWIRFLFSEFNIREQGGSEVLPRVEAKDTEVGAATPRDRGTHGQHLVKKQAGTGERPGMSRCVSPARSNASLSDASSEGSSAGYSDLLANSQIGGSRSRGNSSSPATSHGSRSSTEGSSAAAPELEHLRESSKQRVRKHGKSNSRPPPPSWAGGVAVAPQHEPDRAHLIEYDTVQLIHRLAALLHNITKTNDGLRPLHSPGTDSASSTSFSPGASGCQVDTPGALQTPELAQTSLARCTPHEEGPSTAWPEQSSSHQGPQDYFSLHPQRHPYKKRGSPSSSSMSPTKEHALPPRTPGGEIPDMTGAKIAYNSRNPTICFQARNIPAISIEQYLLRIQKCELLPNRFSLLGY